MGDPIARRPLGTGECYEVRIDQNESSHHIRVVTNTARLGTSKLVMCWARKATPTGRVPGTGHVGANDAIAVGAVRG